MVFIAVVKFATKNILRAIEKIILKKQRKVRKKQSQKRLNIMLIIKITGTLKIKQNLIKEEKNITNRTKNLSWSKVENIELKSEKDNSNSTQKQNLKTVKNVYYLNHEKILQLQKLGNLVYRTFVYRAEIDH